MELLTREQILQMEPEALIAAAECHGIEVEGLTPDQVFAEFADFLDDFAAIAGVEP